MRTIFYVGVGGFCGACFRYLITQIMQRWLPGFPVGTLFSNVLAGFVIGLIIGVERNNAAIGGNLKIFLMSGLLGGLSTFSTFSMETAIMLENGNHLSAGMNALLNLSLSLAGVFAGCAIIKSFVHG